MGARITPHSPLPKGKKLVLGNMGYKELLTWERNATGSECVGKPPGRKTTCDMGSRTSEEDMQLGKLRQAVCTSKEEKTRGKKGGGGQGARHRVGRVLAEGLLRLDGPAQAAK